MAKLNKTTQLAFQGMWLSMWRLGGKPQIRNANQNDVVIDPQGLNIRVIGKVRHRYGVARSLMVLWGNHIITDLVAKLGGKRLTKAGCINIRSAAGEWRDIHQLAQLVRWIHIEAAQALNDMEAQRAAKAPWVDSIEEMGSQNRFQPRSVSTHCLTDDLDEIAGADGLDNTADEQLWGKYGNDFPEHS